MPYTPPSRSPGPSAIASPLGSRQHSLTEMHQSSPQRSPRPNLPRSAYSAAYLQKSRRGPTFQTLSPPLDDKPSATHYEHPPPIHVVINPSLRQSPPPITDAKGMPAGAIMSPPDSTQNSSDEEEPSRSRPRQVQGFEELTDAVRSLDVSREPSSPAGSVDDGKPLTLKLRSNKRLQIDSPRQPTHSHTQSADAATMFERRGSQSSVNTYNSSDSDDEDLMPKPPLLRKKSGELVKPAIRPSSRRRHSSMPGTPTFSKAVHFNDNIEQVRHFLQVDRPIAVSAGTSPAEDHDDQHDYQFIPSTDAQRPQTSNAVTWELRLANFPADTQERRWQPIRADTLTLSPDHKSLIGVVAVANLAFNKHVVVRFTLDYWKTTSEVIAEYDQEQKIKPREDGYDQFKFSIKLSDQANLETRTLLLCFRYDVNGQQHWDSNDNQNYQVDFIKKVKTVVEEPKRNALPHSNKGASSLPRSRSTPMFEEDFGRELETAQLRFKNSRDKLQPTTPPPTIRKHNNSGQQFGSRYDFGASLSAALSTAQAALGEKSGIKTKPGNGAPKATYNPSFFTGSPQANTGSPRPEAMLAKHQTLDSRAYQEFVSKYCFVSTSTTSL